MDIGPDLHALAEANRHGWNFLAAYGLTWLVCAWAWRWRGARIGGYATLFQGMVALPLALALGALLSGPPRPVNPLVDALSVILSTGQLFALPVLVYCAVVGRYTVIPVVSSLVVAVHFAPYSWLYQTPWYIVMGAAIALGLLLVLIRYDRDRADGADSFARDQRSVAIGTAVCALTGTVLLLTAIIVLWLA